MKYLYILFGTLLLIIGLAGIRRSKDEFLTHRYGRKIVVVIDYVPNCLLINDVYNSIKFEFKGKIYSKQIGGSLCETLKEGDKLSLIYNDEKEIFLYEKEDGIIEMYSSIFILILGFYSIYIGAKLKS